jgi:hypothetical protein
VREFDHFGDCFCTCALIIWTVLLHPLLSSLVLCEDEPTRHSGGDLILSHAIEDCRLPWPPSLYLLAVVGVYLVCRARGYAVLIFDLADLAKALVQFEWSSDASQEATAQLV